MRRSRCSLRAASRRRRAGAVRRSRRRRGGRRGVRPDPPRKPAAGAPRRLPEPARVAPAALARCSPHTACGDGRGRHHGGHRDAHGRGIGHGAGVPRGACRDTARHRPQASCTMPSRTRAPALMVRALADLARGSLACTPQPSRGHHVRRQDRQGRNRHRLRTQLARGARPHPCASPGQRLAHGLRRGRVTGTRGGAHPRAARARERGGAEHRRTVLATAMAAITVACATGAVQLLELQRAGKRPMSAEAFLRGFPAGSRDSASRALRALPLSAPVKHRASSLVRRRRRAPLEWPPDPRPAGSWRFPRTPRACFVFRHSGRRRARRRAIGAGCGRRRGDAPPVSRRVPSTAPP